jgi:hypothetical protein
VVPAAVNLQPRRNRSGLAQKPFFGKRHDRSSEIDSRFPDGGN